MPSGEDLNCLIHSGILKATNSHWARPSQGKKKNPATAADSWELVGTWALMTTHFHPYRANTYLRSSRGEQFTKCFLNCSVTKGGPMKLFYCVQTWRFGWTQRFSFPSPPAQREAGHWGLDSVAAQWRRRIVRGRARSSFPFEIGPEPDLILWPKSELNKRLWLLSNTDFTWCLSHPGKRLWTFHLAREVQKDSPAQYGPDLGSQACSASAHTGRKEKVKTFSIQ